jgi:predicted Zn-dependent peptidase
MYWQEKVQMEVNMQIIENEKLQEKVYRIDHKSGLTVFVIPKPQHAKTYAIIATKFGSVDSCFQYEGDKTPTVVPDGIAHFLEHKLFDNEDGNAFEQYGKTGASANAFTSFDKTAYLFSCTDRFEESLEILLNLVQKPYFTKESVEKEQGIIGQEISMYEDDPDWRVMINLLHGIYQNNPVRIDIAGTKETISKIDDELLYRCYQSFYDLSNMALCIAGNIEVAQCETLLDRTIVTTAKQGRPKTCFEPEPDQVANSYVEESLLVSKPLFMIGFKDNKGPFSGREAAKMDAITNIALEMIGGEGSVLYEKLYQSGLINQNFSSEYMCGRNFALSVFSGESTDPKQVQKALLEEIDRMATSADEHLYERCKKVIYGQTVRQFNSVERIATNIMGAYFDEMGLFDMTDVFFEITFEDIQERLKNHFVREHLCLSVINPNQ